MLFRSYARQALAVVADRHLEGAVRFVGQVPHSDVPSFFSGAVAFVFASSCENCPNTLCEAMVSGLPIACSNVLPMPEFAGDAVAYFDPTQPTSIADALEPLLHDSTLRARLARATQARVRGQTWSASFDRVVAAMMDACHVRRQVPRTESA